MQSRLRGCSRRDFVAPPGGRHEPLFFASYRDLGAHPIECAPRYQKRSGGRQRNPRRGGSRRERWCCRGPLRSRLRRHIRCGRARIRGSRCVNQRSRASSGPVALKSVVVVGSACSATTPAVSAGSCINGELGTEHPEHSQKHDPSDSHRGFLLTCADPFEFHCRTLFITGGTCQFEAEFSRDAPNF